MTGRTFTLPCHCESRSLAWVDHAASCPFAIMGRNREIARREGRRAGLGLTLVAGVILGFSLGVLLGV